MRKYQSDATSYNAIVEAMQQIRQTLLLKLQRRWDGELTCM